MEGAGQEAMSCCYSQWAHDQAAATAAMCYRAILTSQKGNTDRADLFSDRR